MAENLPERSKDALSPWQKKRAARDVQTAKYEVFRHELQMTVEAAKDQADSRALSEAIRFATEEELAFMQYALTRCDGSATAIELVARKLDLFSHVNNHRIAGRFG